MKQKARWGARALAGSVASLAACCALSAPAAAASAGYTVAICEDENEWPPYSYFLRHEGKKTGQVTGFAVDVIGDILNRHQIVHSITMIPWARCLAVAQLGERFQMVLNLSASPERQAVFLLSRPYYTLASYYYYSRRHHPNGLNVKTVADLKKYRICGIFGYNYAAFGFAPGEVDDGTKDFGALIAKLHIDRCSAFVEHENVMKGFALIGKDYLSDPDIGKAPIPGRPAGAFRFGVSRKFAHAQELHALIETELAHMEESGRLRELWTKYDR